MPLTLFTDSDVVISSLLSAKGAAYLLINHTYDINLFVSNLSRNELEIVAAHLGIALDDLRVLLEKKFNLINLKQSMEEAKREFKDYVTDKNDAHIVLGANEAKARFLITYNIKHFKVEKIKTDFNILVMTPGQFLQYLRSLQ